MGKILSVDDSAVIRRIIRGAVEMLQYSFLEAGDGFSALALLETEYQEVELILLDVNMPGMSGLDLLERLKQDERFKSIPVMMVTTESERTRMIRALKAGAVNYVCKPFTQEELTTKMVESLGQGMGF